VASTEAQMQVSNFLSPHKKVFQEFFNALANNGIPLWGWSATNTGIVPFMNQFMAALNLKADEITDWQLYSPNFTSFINALNEPAQNFRPSMNAVLGANQPLLQVMFSFSKEKTWLVEQTIKAMQEYVQTRPQEELRFPGKRSVKASSSSSSSDRAPTRKPPSPPAVTLPSETKPLPVSPSAAKQPPATLPAVGKGKGGNKGKSPASAEQKH
jgi:hypothetical protein